MERRRWAVALALWVLASTPGCKVGPRDFRSLANAAPHVRSRAATMGDGLPESVAVPALIDRLNDPDEVVQLSANASLKRRTGQDFGFKPWSNPAERAESIRRWESWWRGRQAGMSNAAVVARPRVNRGQNNVLRGQNR